MKLYNLSSLILSWRQAKIALVTPGADSCKGEYIPVGSNKSLRHFFPYFQASYPSWPPDVGDASLQCLSPILEFGI